MKAPVLLIPRLALLNQIGNLLHGVMQWSRFNNADGSQRVTEYYHKAEALIEVLEVQDCGSIGGFDAGQPVAFSVFDRWDWLYRKHDNPEGKRFACKIVSYEDIKAYFHGN